MNWKYVGVALLVVIVLALGIGAAYWTGFGPAPGGAGDDEPLTEFPTQTPAADGSTVRTTVTSTTTAGPPFVFTIDRVEDCGLTCREVTATLQNSQAEPATGVTVYSRIYAGQNTTASDAIVWEGKDDVGTIEAGAAYTSTRRVELSLAEASAIERAGGWVTIVTTVDSDERTVTFRDSEQVA